MELIQIYFYCNLFIVNKYIYNIINISKNNINLLLVCL
jgi:hypothetical protein